MGNLKRRIRKLEADRIKELYQAMDELTDMIVNGLRSIGLERRIHLVEEMKKLRASCGSDGPREPLGFKQNRIEVFRAISDILGFFGKIDTEVKDMVIKGLKEKVGIYDIYREVITTF